MRMWQIRPEYLCKNHLLGEHNELHKFKPTFEKHHSITGRIFPVVQIEPESMKKRHNEIAKEMIRRGYNHKSPYEQPDLSYLSNEERFAKVDKENSLEDLMLRCPDCRNRIINK